MTIFGGGVGFVRVPGSATFRCHLIGRTGLDAPVGIVRFAEAQSNGQCGAGAAVHLSASVGSVRPRRHAAAIVLQQRLLQVRHNLLAGLAREGPGVDGPVPRRGHILRRVAPQDGGDAELHVVPHGIDFVGQEELQNRPQVPPHLDRAVQQDQIRQNLRHGIALAPVQELRIGRAALPWRSQHGVSDDDGMERREKPDPARRIQQRQQRGQRPHHVEPDGVVGIAEEVVLVDLEDAGPGGTVAGGRHDVPPQDAAHGVEGRGQAALDWQRYRGRLQHHIRRILFRYVCQR
mmetsp:Transcript_27348/g.64065  ORF Transcript_27348/g.64065 Transcript_27348/m.64065 type:complete len:290 (-) Transcript_27348:558-1427(-)